MPKMMADELNRKRKDIESYAYSSGYKITLNDGRVIEMKRFTQDYIYSGLIEGFPRDENVSGDYEIIPAMGERGFEIFHPVKRWDVYKDLNDSYKKYQDTLQNCPVLTPRIKCTSEFESIKITKIENGEPGFDKHYSFTGLTIFWYQDNFAFPIEPEVLDRIKRIEWDKYSEELGAF